MYTHAWTRFESPNLQLLIEETVLPSFFLSPCHLPPPGERFDPFSDWLCQNEC